MATAIERRLADAVEAIADASQKNVAVSEAILATQRELNEKFILHQSETGSDHKLICAEIVNTKVVLGGIAEDFKATVYPLLKTLVYALIVIAGAATALKLSGAL